jgi:hypothetical protein
LRKIDSPARGWAVPALLALTGLVLLGLFSTELGDPDAWWHLKTGQYIVEHHRLPWPDPFAYTTAAAPEAYPGELRTRHFNLTHEWLSQAAMYLVESAGGLGAVVFGKALLLAAVCGLTGWMARRRSGSWLWGVTAAMAAASLAVEFAHDRPSILSYLFTASFMAIFESRRRFWLVPVLALVWANCHGGFFLGWVVCGAYAAGALAERARDSRRVLAASATAVLVSGLNPNGFGVVATLLDYRRSTLTSTLLEWSRADLWGPPYSFDLLLYGAALVLAANWRRVRLSDWLLFAAFAAASLMAFRNEMLIGLLAPVLIADYFPLKRQLPRLAAPAVTVLLAAVLVWGTVRGRFFQLRAADWRFPAGAASFLADRHIAAPLFNTYEYGGYLIWRGLPVFIDGRALSEKVFENYRQVLGAPPGDPGRRAVLERYDIGAVVMNAFEYVSGTLYPLAIDLANSPEWKLVYNDEQALVFLRDPPPGTATIDKRSILDHFEAECRMHVERDPEFTLCARALGDFYLRSGDRSRALRALSFYLAHPAGPDPEARRAYMNLLAAPQ